jgi:hypothetical protein
MYSIGRVWTLHTVATTFVCCRTRSSPLLSHTLCVSRHRTKLRRLDRDDHMTKTLVATRQVSSAAAGGFVKNVIGLQIHPATQSMAYNLQASRLVVCFPAASASITCTTSTRILVSSAVSPWKLLNMPLHGRPHYLGVESGIVLQRLNRPDSQPRAFVWA